MSFAFGVLGIGNVVIKLQSSKDLVQAGGTRGMRRTVQGGASIVRGNASGRPGPRVITGDFRRSISGDIVSAAEGFVSGQIKSSAVQALRLEFGFSGPDSLGRKYNQPPYPSFQPSVPAIAELAEAEMSEAILKEFA